MKHFTKFLLLFPFTFFTKSIAEEIHNGSVTARHIEKGGVGYDSGYTTLQGFLIADPDLALTPFLDLRGHIFNDETWAANAGVGVRKILGNRIYGMNSYYDYRGTKHLGYNQASLGLETLGELFDVRINGYLPFGKKTTSAYDVQFYSFSDHYLLFSEKYEFAMKGANAEAGFQMGKCSSWNFYAAGGPYYYRGEFGGNAWGGKVRLKSSYKEYISLELIDSYDNVFHNNFQGQIYLSLPLGRKSKKEKPSKYSPSLLCKMGQSVERNEIIPVNKERKYPVAINPLTNSPYYFVFVDNTSASNGTYESPYHSLAQAENASDDNQIIYVFPGDGTTKNMDTGIVLKSGQRLLGSVNPYTFATTKGPVTIPALSSTAPQITNLVTEGAGVTLSKNNELSGLILTQTSGPAITGIDPENFLLSSCTIEECGQAGMGTFPVQLEVNSSFAGIFDSNHLNDNVNGGILVLLNDGTSSASITMTNNTGTQNGQTTGGAAFLTIDPNGEIGTCSLSVSGNTFVDNGSLLSINVYNLSNSGLGSFQSFTGSFSLNTFENNGQGINYGVNADVVDLSIKDNHLSNNSNSNLAISDGYLGRIGEINIVLDGNEINGAGSDSSVQLSASCETFNAFIVNNSISDNSSSGIVFYNERFPLPDMNVVILKNTISNNQNTSSNAGGGISIDGFNSLYLTIEKNELGNNVGGDAIGGFGSSTPAPQGNAIATFKDNHLTDGETLNFQFWGEDPYVGCLSIIRNTSDEPTAYFFSQQNTGPCYIAPTTYETENTGGFSLSGVIPVSSCLGL